MKRKILTTFFVLVFLTSGILLASCKKDKTNVPIMSPTISVAGNKINWNTIIGAKGFKIKFNDNNWQNVSLETLSIDFPKADGDYIFSVVALANSKKNDSKVSTFEFKVESAPQPNYEKDGYFFSFSNPLNTFFRLNQTGEFQSLPTSGNLNFSEVDDGASYILEFYVKGGGYDSQSNIYVTDSAISTVSFTKKPQLATPAPLFNSSNNKIEWQAIDNATSYQVTINGQKSSTDKLFVDAALEVGEYELSVKAVSSSSNYEESAPSHFNYVVQKSQLLSLTKQGDFLYWDNELVDLVEFSTDQGATFNKALASNIEYTEGIKFKVLGRFDEQQKTLFLQSDILNVEKRQAPQTSFDSSGIISWNEQDAGAALKYGYKLFEATEPENFTNLDENSLSFGTVNAGAYNFKLFSDSYLSTGQENTFYIASDEIALTINVLQAPDLNYESNKLTWQTDANAQSYEYKQEDGEWQIATSLGFAEVAVMDTYYVRAIGSEALGNYSVNSKTSSLFFDPNLDKIDGVLPELLSFKDSKYINLSSVPIGANITKTANTSIISDSDDVFEKVILSGANGSVLKMTAGNSGPRQPVYEGNADGAMVELFKDLKIQDIRLLNIRIYIKTVANDAATFLIVGLNGPSNNGDGLYGSEDWLNGVETNKWIDLTINTQNIKYVGGDDGIKNYVGMSALKYITVAFQNVGVEGDIIYIDNISYVPTDLAINTDANGECIVNFNNNASKYYSGVASAEIALDNKANDGYALKARVSGQGMLSLFFDNVELLAGDRIIIGYKFENANSGLMLNGVWKVDMTKQEGEDYKELVYIVNTAITLNLLELKSYHTPGKSDTMWIDYIKIVKGTVNEQLAFEGVNFNNSNDINYASFGSIVEDSEAEDGYALEFITEKNKHRYISYENVPVNTGDKIVVRYKTDIIPGFGLGIHINGAYKATIPTNVTGYRTYEWTITSDIDIITSIGFQFWGVDGNVQILIDSIKIIKAGN